MLKRRPGGSREVRTVECDEPQVEERGEFKSLHLNENLPKNEDRLVLHYCHQCGSEISNVFNDPEDVILFGWPRYWWGGAPTEPQGAEFYFCGSNCAVAHVNENI